MFFNRIYKKAEMCRVADNAISKLCVGQAAETPTKCVNTNRRKLVDHTRNAIRS